MSAVFHELIVWACAEGLDPARVLQEYLAEKDSCVTYAEAQHLVCLHG